MSQWYYTSQGQQVGPVAEDILRMHIQTGTVSLQDMVWAEGMPQWVQAGTIPVFTQAAGAPAGVPPVTGEQAFTAGPPIRNTYLKPHRGTTVLVLGILGLAVCCICGIIAWSMGSTDLSEMKAGRMDRSGEQMTQAGKICGMISVIMALVGGGIYLLMRAIGAGRGVFN